MRDHSVSTPFLTDNPPYKLSNLVTDPLSVRLGSLYSLVVAVNTVWLDKDSVPVAVTLYGTKVAGNDSRLKRISFLAVSMPMEVRLPGLIETPLTRISTNNSALLYEPDEFAAGNCCPTRYDIDASTRKLPWTSLSRYIFIRGLILKSKSGVLDFAGSSSQPPGENDALL